MDNQKRLKNQKEFPSWTENEDGSRIYWFEVKGKLGWKARYVKETNSEEITIRFYQEIYNGANDLVEIHEKYPTNKSHLKL
jgi:hypothetical protein